MAYADKSIMTWLLAVLLIQEPVLLTQEPGTQADQIRAAMAASIEKQRASVRVQAQAVGTDSAIGLSAEKPEIKNALLATVGSLIGHIVP
jgi:hypothetical protein